MEPNEEQQKLIENREGVYLVDAGAGTGKTFSLTSRYSGILREVEPDEVLLATFTRNAAEQMKERIIRKNPAKAEKIEGAPIQTFHSLCRDILRERGVDAPRLIGIDQSVPGELDLIQSNVRETREFEKFFSEFQSAHPEHEQLTRIIERESQLLELLRNISARGIIPTEEGWFGKSEEYLDGDFEEFMELFRKKNSPRKGKRGKKQSRLRERLYSYDYRLLPEESPGIEDVRGDRGTKKVRRDFARRAFKEDRSEIKQFVHDLYLEYLEYCLQRGYLNFGFLMVLTYVMLHQDGSTRRELEFSYVMIDEFQDTNEIQFKLALLLCGDENLCVVGDWKQSIYGFQHASVRNITDFRERLESYSDELNQGEKRTPLEDVDVNSIELFRNYRSGQEILDSAEEALDLKARKNEKVDQTDLKSLKSMVDREGFTGKIQAESEPEAIASEIGELLDDGYSPGEIAVLVRSRKTGFEIHDRLRELDYPVIYEGGVKLFERPPALMLLAWLRVLNDDERGYATVLERDGFTISEAEGYIEKLELPDELEEFRERLEQLESVGEVASKIFDRYDLWSPEADRLVDVLENTYEKSYLDINLLSDFITESMESGEVYEIEADDEGSCVRIQTVHGSKGLEYPVVFIAGLNQSIFPSTQTSKLPIEYSEPIGLRARKSFIQGDFPYSYDSWKAEILFKTLDGDMDEERRLLYVAMTRAEERLYLSATEGSESEFFTGLEIGQIETGEPSRYQGGEKNRADFNPVIENGGAERVTPTSDFETSGVSEGYHEFADKFVRQGATPEDEIEKNLVGFIRGLEGDLEPEKEFILPVENLTVRGRIDLIAICDDEIQIYDYKLGETESLLQLSIYHHAVDSFYSRPVETNIYRMDTDEIHRIEPMDKKEIVNQLRN